MSTVTSSVFPAKSPPLLTNLIGMDAAPEGGRQPGVIPAHTSRIAQVNRMGHLKITPVGRHDASGKRQRYYTPHSIKVLHSAQYYTPHRTVGQTIVFYRLSTLPQQS